MRMFICKYLPKEYVKAIPTTNGMYLVISWDELDGEEIYCPPDAFLDLVHSKPYYLEPTDE